jgi:hypothetical protein
MSGFFEKCTMYDVQCSMDCNVNLLTLAPGRQCSQVVKTAGERCVNA